MSAVSDEFDEYVRAVYPEGIGAAQRLELSRAFAAGGLDIFAHVASVCAAAGFSAEVRERALRMLVDDLKSLAHLPKSAPEQPATPCPRRYGNAKRS
jgi:diaminopimelate decarboxylase